MATNYAAAPMANNLLTPPPVPEPSVSYKNQLQEYTQKASLQFPVYQTLKEGPPHACVFRSTVWVNGLPYVSSTVFHQSKSAEQDAARVALSRVPPLPPPLRPHIVNHVEGPHLRPFINQDTIFAKSILIEYAVKKHIEKPVYATIQLAGNTPTFSSSVALGGKTYCGHVCRSKKEAEQLAARAAILSVLDSHGKDIYDIINAKHKVYCAINGLKETLGAATDSPVLNAGNRVDIDMNKQKGVTDVSINIPSSNTSLSIPNYNTSFSTQDVPASSEPVLETVLPSGLAQGAKKKKKRKGLIDVSVNIPSSNTFLSIPNYNTSFSTLDVPASSEPVLETVLPSGLAQSAKKKKKNKKTATREDQHVPASSETVLETVQQSAKKQKKNKRTATMEDQHVPASSETVLETVQQSAKKQKKNKRTATMEDQHVPASSETVFPSGLAQSAKKQKKNKRTATREDQSKMMLPSGLAELAKKKKKKHKKTATKKDQSGMTCDMCGGCGYASRHPIICG